MDCAARPLEQKWPSVSVLPPLFLVNTADNRIRKSFHVHEFSQFSFCHSLYSPPHAPPPLKFLFFALLFLCLSPLSVLFSCYPCGLSPSWLFNSMGLSAESTKLLKENPGRISSATKRHQETKGNLQPASSNHSTVRLSLMYVEVIFFPHSDETRQELPKVPPITCYFHLLLPSLNSTSLASPVVSWKQVTSSQNSLQSRKNGTTFILRYHILQSKLRVSFLTASTINFPTLSKQQEIGQQREPSLQKSTCSSQSWVHFIGVSSGGDYLLPDPQNILCSVLSLIFLKKQIFPLQSPFLQKVSPAFQVGKCQVTLGKSEVTAYGWGSFWNAKLA